MEILFQNIRNIYLEVYSDDDWVGSIVDKRSTIGYCTFMGGNLVTWRNKKQPIVAKFSVEVEFRVMVQEIHELL